MDAAVVAAALQLARGRGRGRRGPTSEERGGGGGGEGKGEGRVTCQKIGGGGTCLLPLPLSSVLPLTTIATEVLLPPPPLGPRRDERGGKGLARANSRIHAREAFVGGGE